MGKIILNDIEYGIGISNGVNVDTTNLVEKDSIVTTLDDTVTDEQIPSAKAVHTAIQNVSAGVPTDVYSKTEVDDLLADKADSTDIIDAYTKTEVDGLLANKADSSAIIDAYSKTEVDDLLTAKADTTALEHLEGALTGYSTLEYLEEVKTDLENEIANINIPTTLPASDVYAWAKASTKPTYTASEVGALASNGTAVNASKVANALTISLNGVSQGAYNGSTVKNINITPASIGALPTFDTNGVNELGQFLDLHKVGSTADYDARISVDAHDQIILSDTHGSLIVNHEINNLKNTVVSGKTSVANAINGKLGTTLSNQTSFADMAYYINTIPSMGSVGSLPSSSKFIQINLPVTREVLGGNTLAKGKTVTIDGGLIMFVCDDDRESLKITPISSAIKVYGRDDSGAITVNAGTSFSTDGYEWFIVNPSRTQLSCIRVGISDADKWNPEINISIS